MPDMKDFNTGKHVDGHGGLPFKAMVGFVLSIILTAFSLWSILYSDFSLKWIPVAISVLAFTLAILQLFDGHAHKSKNEQAQ